MHRLTATTLLLLATFAGGWLYQRSRPPGARPAAPRRPLEELPQGLLGPGWSEEDLPLPERVVEISGVADHVYRRFTDGRHRFILYVGYVPGDASNGVHHPEVCFPRQGLRLEERNPVTVPAPERSGSPDLDFYETRWASEFAGDAYCLYSFWYRGGFCPEETALRWAGRLQGISHYALVMLVGEPASTREATRRVYFDALRRLVPAILEHFPRPPEAVATTVDPR